jgi:opacity protein-like surface antigen
VLKLAVVVFAVALAGTAAAAGWKDLRIDGTSEAAFNQSLAVFKKELSPERQKVFTDALMDIWVQGTVDAKRDQREFTVNDYYKQLDGLGYEQVVTFTDPTGATAKERYRDAKREDVADSTRPVSTWQGQYHGSQEARSGAATRSLDSGELMKTRQGGPVTHDGRPVNQDAQRAQPK